MEEDKMGFERLYKNLIDIIKEEQAKLGFRREAIRLYYPLSSLNHFFETEYSEEEMLNKLQELPDFIKETLGDIFYLTSMLSNKFHQLFNKFIWLCVVMNITASFFWNMETKSLIFTGNFDIS